MSETPPIPARLVHLPVVRGLAVPWITPVTPDGRHHFGKVDAERLRRALVGRLCSICGQSLEHRIVFAMRAVDLRRMLSPEPGMHPECAHYSAAACPMLAGTMIRYSGAGSAIAPEDGVSMGDPQGRRAGHPAEAWQLVWVSDYRVTTDPATQLPAALILPTSIAVVRPIDRA